MFELMLLGFPLDSNFDKTLFEKINSAHLSVIQ